MQAVDKVKNSVPSELARSAERLSSAFIIPGASKEINIPDKLRLNITQLLEGGIHDSQSHKRLVDTLELLQNETLVLMAMNSFPRYLRSADYALWRERRDLISTGSVEIVMRSPRGTPTASPAATLSKTVSTRLNEILDKRVVEQALSSGSWLSGLLAAVEHLPICVSLSTARRSRPGFPLVYVNKYFEETTGYTQAEIVGQNCRFLQKGRKPGDCSEAESIERLGKALRSATPVKVSITNYRKDGRPFRNLLAMKPIFDFLGNYVCVVGVQFDVTYEKASAGENCLPSSVINVSNSVFNSLWAISLRHCMYSTLLLLLL
jgi:PAS domain S-box-containing protein